MGKLKQLADVKATRRVGFARLHRMVKGWSYEIISTRLYIKPTRPFDSRCGAMNSLRYTAKRLNIRLKYVKEVKA